MNILFMNPGAADSEINFFNAFKAGYESNGLIYTYASTPTAMLYNVGASNFISSITSGMNSGFNCFLFPSSDWKTNFRSLIPQLSKNISISGNGNLNSESLFVFPAGSNLFINSIDFNENISVVTCGAGISTNDTGYSCEFFDRHPPYDTWQIHSISALSNTSARIILTTASISAGVVVMLPDEIIHLSEISGWPNNPNGLMYNLRYYDKDPYTGLTSTPYYYNMFDIAWELGSINYLPTTGIMKKTYQSYSHAYICGKILAVKNVLNCSIWEARFRCQQSTALSGKKDFYNGYGVINVQSAISYNGKIPIEPYFKPSLINETITAELAGINEDIATYYFKINQRHGQLFELYDEYNNYMSQLALPQGINNIYPITEITYQKPIYTFRNKKYYIKITNNNMSVKTNLFTMPGRSKYKIIKVRLTKKYIQNSIYSGYGSNYGENYGE